MTLRSAVGVWAGVMLLAGCGGSSRVLVGAGTTTVDSGLMQYIEAQYGGDISIVGGSTAEILQLGAQGSIDVAIVHDPTQELEFVAAHPNAERSEVFSSRFLIVGPPALVGLLDSDTPAGVFSEIASNQWPFVSRGDGSGTHSRELAIWAESSTAPAGDWYLATGQGMGFTLQVADQRAAFTLVEEGAFLAAAEALALTPVVLLTTDELLNPYSAMLIGEPGRAFYEWLLGPEGESALLAANESIFGRVVYSPSQDGD